MGSPSKAAHVMLVRPPEVAPMSGSTVKAEARRGTKAARTLKRVKELALS